MNPTPAPTNRTRHRSLVVLALVALLAVIGNACGDDADSRTSEVGSSATSPSPGDSAVDDGTAAPVVITHKFGTVEVPADPQRVVSVGYSDQDDLLALGVIPVGIRDWYGDQPFATWPWAQDALGDAEPEVLPSSEPNFEQIAALEPDLIIGVSSGMTADDYALLSAIAPTIAQSDEYPDFGTPWQARTRQIGAALNRADQAEALVAGIEAQIAAAREDHPEFAGASAAVAFFYEDGPGAYAAADVRSRIMADLGFVIPAAYEELAGDSFYASFSEEELDRLDVDVLVWLSGTDETTEQILATPLRDGFGPALAGREVFVGDLLGGAFSFASPLSLGYLLDELVPELALAVDGDPATPVTSAVDVGAADPSSGGTDADPTPDDASAEAAMAALALVFDSATPFADKAPYLEAAADLEASNEAYAAAGEGLGGIALAPTSATVDGTVATVTYDVLFGGVAAYEDLERTLELVDGVWTVTRADYCGFLESSRVSCF